MKISRISVANVLTAAGILLIVCIALLAPHTYAQFGLLGVEGALSISLVPSHPGPGDTVRLTARSSVLDLRERAIVWRANGKMIAQGVGTDSAEVLAGALGAETDIEVDVILPNEITARARMIIIPTELDLLIDSDSFIPPFYRGRARPSAGTNLRLEAIPRFKRGGGAYVANPDLIFTWRRNGEVIGEVSGRGKSTAIIPAPHLFGTDRVTVEVRTSDGLLSNEAGLSSVSIQPVLTLYQDHPLFGILYNQALGRTTFVPESEMTFAAMPYFAQARRADDQALSFVWRVNDTEVKPGGTNQNKITINAQNSTGVALLGLELTHATNSYVDAKGLWNITFSSGAFLQDQFRNLGQ